MIDELLMWLNHRSEPGLARTPLVGGIVVGLYRNSSNVTFIIFDAGGEPGAVVKVARRATAEAALVAEYAALDHLNRIGGEAVRRAPRPLALDRVCGRLVLVESHLAGKPMTADYYCPGHTRDPRRVADDFSAAGRWLQQFQLETATGEVVMSATAIDEWIDAVVMRYRCEIGWSDAEDELFGAVRQRALRFEGTVLPLVGVHGDYWMGNLLMERGQVVGVVDWELARPGGLPFADVFKFPTSYGFYLDRAYPGSGAVPGHPDWGRAREHWKVYGDWSNLIGFEYAYFGHGSLPELVRRFITQHLGLLGISPRLTAVFFPLFLAEQAMTLDDPVFRDGYRSALVAFSRERNSTWLWNDEPLGRGASAHAGR